MGEKVTGNAQGIASLESDGGLSVMSRMNETCVAG